MAKYPGTLESNNPKEFGIVYATEVAGHKTVQNLEELNTLPNAILSRSKTNTDNDAIGQIWFVIDQNKYYQLVSWEPKEWIEFEAGVTNEQFTNTLNSLRTEISNNLDTKVDKEEGKGLSSNDYSDEERSKLENLPEDVYSKEEVNTLGNQLKAIAEARLPIDSFNQWSVNVAMKEEIPTKVSQLENDLGYLTEHQDISGKVDKVEGKQLSTEDFTTALKTKLESLFNYDDTTVSNKIEQLETNFNTLLNSNPDTAINSFNEIIAFLDNISDSQTLEGIIAGIQKSISDNLTTVDNYTVNGYKISENPALNKVDIGLENVDNTADLDKPISNATQAALDVKADIDDLSNVLAEEVIDSTTFPEIDTVTREELKKDLFIDMFNEAAGDYGYARMVDGVFDCMLNGVTGITYEEAIRIFIASAHMTHNIRHDLNAVFSYSKGFRTYFPIKSLYLSSGSNIRQSFLGNSDVEVIAFAPYLECLTDCYSAFRNCPKLKKIIGAIRHFADNQSFFESPNLEEVSLMYLNANVNFRYNPKLSLASFKYLVANKTSNTDITITVHPDVYAKLADESNTEWHQVLIDAVSKNISFSTV